LYIICKKYNKRLQHIKKQMQKLCKMHKKKCAIKIKKAIDAICARKKDKLCVAYKAKYGMIVPSNRMETSGKNLWEEKYEKLYQVDGPRSGHRHVRWRFRRLHPRPYTARYQA
jgi:hypothetical protein